MAKNTTPRKVQFEDAKASESPKSDREYRLQKTDQSNEYRVVVFGAAGVGKTSLAQRFTKGTFRENYVPTIEDTYREVITCNKQVCTLEITDTTGSHQFPAMQRLAITRGHAFILVYSITSKRSLEELKPIYMDIIQNKGGTVKDTPIMLVGNKSDETHREVGGKLAEDVAKAWGCGFMETSAKSNHNVKELFQDLLQMEKTRNVSLASENNSKVKGKKGKKDAKAAAAAAQPTQPGNRVPIEKKSCTVM